MKDNYKAENLKFYLTTYDEREKLYQRAKELGYDVYTIEPVNDIVYLKEDGTTLNQISTHSNLEIFARSQFKQLTVNEFLAPQKGEFMEFSDDGVEWGEDELFCDLGEDSPDEFRYIADDGAFWKHMRPIAKPELPQKKGFEEAINHLEEAIKLLRG